MAPRPRFLAIDRSCPSLANLLQVVVQLRSQADRLYVMMIYPVPRLVAKAFVEGLYLPEIGIANPDPVTLRHRATRAWPRWLLARYGKIAQSDQHQELNHYRCTLSIEAVCHSFVSPVVVISVAKMEHRKLLLTIYWESARICKLFVNKEFFNIIFTKMAPGKILALQTGSIVSYVSKSGADAKRRGDSGLTDNW